MTERESQSKQRDDGVKESERGGKLEEPRVYAIDDESASSDPPGDTGLPQDAFARLQAEKDELMRTLIRRQADFENYRKRVERERQEESRRGAGNLIETLLPVLDGFERALRAHDDPAFEEYRKGLELIYRQLSDALSRQGLERIVAAGQPFDPHFHQAIGRVETHEQPDGNVLEVLQDGFLFHGRVLRPSIVRVAIAPEEKNGDESSSLRRETH